MAVTAPAHGYADVTVSPVIPARFGGYALIVDLGPENGSTEVWPGTHRDTTIYVQAGDIKLPPEAVEARRAVRAPLQPTVRAGSVVIRDLRLWHAGMPNLTEQARPMIAMIHWVSWWPAQTVPFPRSEAAFFEHRVLKTDTGFVDGPIKYIAHGGAYDFQEEAA